MTIGPDIEPRIGPALGLNSGDPFSAFRDSASGKLFPLTQAQLDAVLDSIGVARKTISHSYGLQDASGSPQPVVGTQLTVTGTPLYRQAETGYTRLAFTIPEVSTTRATLAAAAAPNLASVSGLFMSVERLTTAGGAGRGVIGLVGASGVQTRLGTNAQANFCVGVTSTGASTTGQQRPYALRYNRTLGTVRSLNDVESLAGTYSAAAVDGEKGLGNSGNPAAAAVLAFWMFAGAHAEWTDAELKAFWQRCGWAIPWAP